MNYYGLDWASTILGLLSIYCLGRKQEIGFIFRIVASLFWLTFAILAQTPAGVVANAAVIVLSITGLRRWRTGE